MASIHIYGISRHANNINTSWYCSILSYGKHSGHYVPRALGEYKGIPILHHLYMINTPRSSGLIVKYIIIGISEKDLHKHFIKHKTVSINWPMFYCAKQRYPFIDFSNQINSIAHKMCTKDAQINQMALKNTGTGSFFSLYQCLWNCFSDEHNMSPVFKYLE